MPHKTVLLAQRVLADPDNNPKVLLSLAQEISDWNTDRRNKIEKLWKNYRKIYQSYVKVHLKGKRTPREAVKYDLLVRKLSGSITRRNEFYSLKCVLRTHYQLLLQFSIFESAYKAMQCKDLGLMLRYLQCQNAYRKDNSVAAVAFLRYADKLHLAEILLYRMVNMK